MKDQIAALSKYAQSLMREGDTANVVLKEYENRYFLWLDYTINKTNFRQYFISQIQENIIQKYIKDNIEYAYQQVYLKERHES